MRADAEHVELGHLRVPYNCDVVFSSRCGLSKSIGIGGRRRGAQSRWCSRPGGFPYTYLFIRVIFSGAGSASRDHASLGRGIPHLAMRKLCMCLPLKECRITAQIRHHLFGLRDQSALPDGENLNQLMGSVNG